MRTSTLTRIFAVSVECEFLLDVRSGRWSHRMNGRALKEAGGVWSLEDCLPRRPLAEGEHEVRTTLSRDLRSLVVDHKGAPPPKRHVLLCSGTGGAEDVDVACDL